MPIAMHRSREGAALFTVMVLVAAVAATAGCRQTRPIPEYEPMLSLNANQPTADAYRPAWAGPAPMPVAKAGGGG